MPLPFDDRGLLPPGIHDATLDEIESILGRYQKTTRRITLMANLRAYVAELRKTGWDFRLVIDGSFVMAAIDEPNDIDAILVLPTDWDFAPLSRPDHYNLVNKRSTGREYKIEVFAVSIGSESERRYLELFAGIRPEWCARFGWDESLQKGLVRVTT